MKKLLLITLIMSVNIQASCVLELKTKKKDAKTYYLNNGQRLSQRIITKLSDQCKINVTLMSVDDVNQLKVDELTQRLMRAKRLLKAAENE